IQDASAGPPSPTSASPVELSVPEGEPNQTIDVATTISPSPEETWTLLEDFRRMSRCIPGLELDTDHGEDTYSGSVQVSLGPMLLNFAGAARVLERDGRRRTLHAIAAGRDVSGSGVRADLTVSAEPAAGGTSVRAHAKLYLSGRAAQFGRAIAGDVSRQLFTEFGACVERTLTTGVVAKPQRMAGGALAWRLLRTRVRSLTRRLTRRNAG
ncbi:MAG TPA: SRPBCC family protein, partial [Solirubrobacteraceae bacterium]